MTPLLDCTRRAGLAGLGGTSLAALLGHGARAADSPKDGGASAHERAILDQVTNFCLAWKS